MRKLIEKEQRSLVVCDNPNCDYEVPFTDSNANLIDYVNVRCPKCGQNLLTPQDYLMSIKILRVVDFINKWFSWILIFYPKKKIERDMVEFHVHEGIKISKNNGGDKPMNLYLSGKITGLNPHEVEHKFHINEVYFCALDYHVINPLKIAPFLGIKNWLCYMITDIWQLLKCDAICLLEDWNYSRGARIEAAIAILTRKQIITKNYKL